MDIQIYIKSQLETVLKCLKNHQSALMEISKDSTDIDDKILLTLKKQISNLEKSLADIKKRIKTYNITDIAISRLLIQNETLLESLWDDIIWNKYQHLDEIKPIITRKAKKEYCKILKSINMQITELSDNLTSENLETSLGLLYNNYNYFCQINDNYKDIFNDDFNGDLKLFKRNLLHNFNDLYLEICLRWPRTKEVPISLDNNYRLTYTIDN